MDNLDKVRTETCQKRTITILGQFGSRLKIELRKLNAFNGENCSQQNFDLSDKRKTIK